MTNFVNVPGENPRNHTAPQNLHLGTKLLVLTNAEGYQRVSYTQLTPVLIEALKEQRAQTERLKTQNAVLKAEATATTDPFEARRREAGTAQAQR